MITLNHLVRKKPAVAASDFRHYWLGEHAERCLTMAPKFGIRNFTKCETLHDDDVTKLLQQLYGTAADAYDFVDQMVINDLEDFKRGMTDSDIKALLAAIHESEGPWIDHGRSDYWFSIEIPQVFPPQPCTATWNNTLLKGFYVAGRLPQLSLEEAQLHWRSCHGAMARQFVEFLPYKKYVQGHRIESRVCDDLKQFLGAEFENIEATIGQAEAWIDRRIVPTLQGPETDRMMRMLVEDIALFVDSGTSHIFATKEHCILDRPVITDTIPSLFNAD
jgi:EthD domain